MTATVNHKIVNGQTYFTCTVANTEIWDSKSKEACEKLATAINTGTKSVWRQVNGKDVYKIWHGTGVKPQYFFKENPTNVVSISQERRNAEVVNHLSAVLK